METTLPQVFTSSGYLVPWNREAIIKRLIKDTTLAEKFFNIPPCTREEAEKIAKKVEKKVLKEECKSLTGAFIREMTNQVLFDLNKTEWYNCCVKNGMSSYDVYATDIGNGFEAKENANTHSNNSDAAHQKKADKMNKEYNLRMIPKKIANLHKKGAIHLHDLNYLLQRNFCQDSDARYPFYYGLYPDGSGNYITVAKAAKHPEVAVSHLATTLGSMQSCFSGGMGYQNFLTFLAPYFEGLEYARIKQCLQMYIFFLGQLMTSRSGQVIFNSIQLTPGVPKNWRNKPVVYKGKIWNGIQSPLKTYGEFEREVRLGFKAVTEILIEGDAFGRSFPFPKAEYTLMREFFDVETKLPLDNPLVQWFDKDREVFSYSENTKLYGNLPFSEIVAPSYKELYELMAVLAAKYGSPYIESQLSGEKDWDNITLCRQCCSYAMGSEKESDSKYDKKMNFENGEHFSLGSAQVVSLNLPRAAYIARGKSDVLYKYLKHLCKNAVDLFKFKREKIDDIVAHGGLPFAMQTPIDPNDTTKRAPPFVDLDFQSYVIGLVGLNELVQSFTGKQMHENKDSWKFGVRVVMEIKQYVNHLAKESGLKISLARTPAESTAQRFAVSDLLDKRYKSQSVNIIKGDVDKALKIVKDTKDLPIYYSNGCHLDVSADVSLTERLRLEGVFFPATDGGNITHIWLGEKKPDAKALLDLILHIAWNTPCEYFDFGMEFTLCLDCGKTGRGIKENCEFCGSKNVDGIARITGYMASLSSYNEAKKEERKRRLKYEI